MCGVFATAIQRINALTRKSFYLFVVISHHAILTSVGFDPQPGWEAAQLRRKT
jgi:hypothetical protein